jgi:hypothetical protein
MAIKYIKRPIYLALGIFAAALATGQPSPLAAQDVAQPYPWCSVGENPQCYFMTRQQCEETVDYHGFCDKNPDFRAAPTSEVRTPPRRPHSR